MKALKLIVGVVEVGVIVFMAGGVKVVLARGLACVFIAVLLAFLFRVAPPRNHCPRSVVSIFRLTLFSPLERRQI